ncbi:MAG: hypothetical protein IT369_09790 [Candidatus Latescibacteria bacterium]|nr:hypothetical protein [Candidatus Latescibacterota bacterium]
MTEPQSPTPREVEILRRLAERKLEIAGDPLNLERKQLWYAHDAGESQRPMVLAEIGGLRDEEVPLPESALCCESPWGRSIERGLRTEIYQFEVLKDDHVVEPHLTTNWQVQVSGYGVEVVQHYPDSPEVKLGARRWESPIKDLDADFAKLRPRTYTADRQATFAEQDRLEAVFGELLPVRIRGRFWWSMGMTWPAAELIGLEELMLAMYDNPAGLHRLMRFLRDDHLTYARWLEGEGLLTRNDQNDYIGSGSMGYTKALGSGHEGPTRLHEQWVLLESQETVGVSPDQFEEFILPYQLSLAEYFGRCYYGCCEPVQSRLHLIEQLPNLARVSVAPRADQEFMARELGDRLVFSRKSDPLLVSTSIFDEQAIRAELRQTLELARGCRIELIMKDVHTLDNHPERLPRWVQLAREVVDEYYR